MQDHTECINSVTIAKQLQNFSVKKKKPKRKLTNKLHEYYTF